MLGRGPVAFVQNDIKSPHWGCRECRARVGPQALTPSPGSVNECLFLLYPPGALGTLTGLQRLPMPHTEVLSTPQEKQGCPFSHTVAPSGAKAPAKVTTFSSPKQTGHPLQTTPTLRMPDYTRMQSSARTPLLKGPATWSHPSHVPSDPSF